LSSWQASHHLATTAGNAKTRNVLAHALSCRRPVRGELRGPGTHHLRSRSTWNLPLPRSSPLATPPNANRILENQTTWYSATKPNSGVDPLLARCAETRQQSTAPLSSLM